MPSVRIRQDTVKTLPYTGAGNSQCIYWDEGLPCFGMRVYPNGRRSYVCSYRVDGRKRLATLGRADILTLDQARKKARSYLGNVADGTDPKMADDTIRASGTLKALAETYLERHAKAKKRSWKNDDRYLKAHVIPKLGARLAGSITSADVARLHSEIGGKSPYTANRVIEVVRKMYNLAATWLLVSKNMSNPAVGIERFREQKRRRYVTPDELPRLSGAINAEQNEFARHAIWLLLFTGLRRNELLNAKWTDVDWKQRTVAIGRTKNGEALLAPLSHAAIARLKVIPQQTDNPYIVCGAVPGQHLVNLRSAWKRICNSVGLGDLRIHDLRRTVGSWLVTDGASLHLVGAVLNHKDQKTTAGYAYFQTQDRQKALDRHGRRVLNLATRRQKSVSKNGSKSRTTNTSLPIAQAHVFSRQQLYDLVWSEPISKLAARHGISDVGLSKACRRADIAVPSRGYWAKREAGQPTQREPLSSSDKCQHQKLIQFRGRRVPPIASESITPMVFPEKPAP